jgi:mono/diheme cytochrome c family protein
MRAMRLLAAIGVLAILVVIAAAVYFFRGYYNVAADAAESDYVSSSLVAVRQASIARHASGIRPPLSMDDRAAIQAGARAFMTAGCVLCHGAPGVMWSGFAEGLNPGPPDLKELAPQADPAQLFWVIKNGIRMTGMPSFSKAGLDDNEIWRLTAFVKNLDKVSDADFKAWTAPVPGQSGVSSGSVQQ